ncbi:hypothetical protein H6G54_27990 [Anabaena cylindrica FACHB-243]|uniref:Ycf66 family protein n=2 Tax=Nostocaceae TaxID=1162 RepID=K9ZEB1_ANACC|nr:Ycf66 family protein [Anabaena cylindrica PCC 7122]MBD2421451.1 hypothetical protein [Anabaena cylindrica FACHB-243]MBY5284571.1 hypothetical protein [Anabaena sp. CCAP 1446/1C]MBY5310824.1 hypothetical protein [Anabaena sp. CCAP 1446/1C]BAY05958.1 Ycf66 family protein [Anabaena cylindrica PCC 7122]
MFTLAQVSFGRNSTSLIGIIYLLFAVAYFLIMLFLLFLRRSKSRNLILVFDIIQLIFVPLIMLFCGFILLFQGWRLDPILQFVQFLLFILITYLLIKDIVFSTIDRK